MAWNRFNLMVLLQILGIAGTGMLVTLALGREYLHMTTAGLILLWVGQILYLNVYMNRIHRDVHKFMEALKNQDTVQQFNRKNQGSFFRKLHASFNEISQNFRLVRMEKEAENQFFRETIKQSASGILAIGEDGSVTLVNQAALDLLGLEEIRNLEQIKQTHPALLAALADESLKDHQLKIRIQGKLVQLAVKACEMNLQGKCIRIFSLLDISRQLAQNETEAWQKLIRVLNHEITNSITPIHILATSLLDLFSEDGKERSPDQVDAEIIGRLVLGLKTLSKRSQGLSDFLNTYNSFTETSEAVYSNFKPEELFKRVCSLLAPEIEKAGMDIFMEISPPGLQLQADEKLIEQTLINLVQNAIHAAGELPGRQVQLKASSLDEQIQLEVTDNGKGIPTEIQDHIFTPFFTTRKGGSGIGLSLARQIMQMHNGSIHAESQEGENTTFTLSF